jgi:hypothetical protein
MELKIQADPEPLLSFLSDPLNGVLQTLHGSVGLIDFGFELVRIETCDGAAGTSELTVRIHPSNRLLDLAATLAAGDVDGLVVEEPSHGYP